MRPTIGLVPDIAKSAWRTYGAKGIQRRALYEVQRRSGLARQREQHPGCNEPWSGFHFAPRLGVPGVRKWLLEVPGGEQLRDSAVVRGQRLLEGKFNLFGGAEVDIGWPPRWHVHPQTLRALPADVHWSEISDNDPEVGDIKDIWEPGRMGWVGTLLRAYAVTNEDRWVEAFWQGVLDWRRTNPPYVGVHWTSGQEVALRGIAIIQGLAGFSDHPASTPSRLAEAGGLLRDSMYRTESTLGYALSQRNNHALSEAAFLWTMATTCPSIARGEWLLRKSSNALRECIRDQFADDGSYAQHSFTYQRLALHVLLWVAWIGRQVGTQPPDDLAGAVQTSVDLLVDLLEDTTGRIPNIGSNDGALLFRLSDTNIQDFRPVLVHAASAVGATIPVPRGRWDEECVWFGLTPASGADRPLRAHPQDRQAFHVLRGPASHAVLRAGPLRHRLSHADQLHVDIWMEGRNVARDPGTFRYSGPAIWRNSLASDRVHNVPLVDGTVQARRLGRFFWVDWPEPSILARFEGSGSDALVTELRLRQARSVTLRRLIARIDDSYVIADLVEPACGHVRWNLPTGTEVTWQPGGAAVTEPGFAARFEGSPGEWQVPDPSDKDPASGWESTIYGERSPLRVLVVPLDALGRAIAAFAPRVEDLLVPDTSDAWWQAIIDPTANSLAGAIRNSRALLSGS